MKDSTPLQESWGYTRPAALKGVELLDAHHCRQQLTVFNVAHSIAVLHTWRGEVLYKGQRCHAGPGQVVCLEPGEMHVATPYAMTHGSFDVFIVDTEVLREHVAEHGICSGYPAWRVIAHTASLRLRRELGRFFTMGWQGDTAMQLQCGFTELMGAVVQELFEPPRASIAHLAPAPTVAEKIRDCIHDDEPGLDLEKIARVTGLSRFQVVRSFKRRYGLPPQTYQLHLKIARAQKQLRRGFSPAEVATECGFVDQSHLGRHFKRFVGLTPREYARLSIGREGRIHGRWHPRIGIWVQPYTPS